MRNAMLTLLCSVCALLAADCSTAWAVPITGMTGPGGVGFTDGSSDLVLWLKADTITGLSDGNTVATWTDSSGKSNDATASASPEYQSTGFAGGPTVVFDPTDSDFFTTANSINTTAESFFFATQITAAAGDKALLGNAGNGSYTLRDRSNSSTEWNITGFAVDGSTGIRSTPALGSSELIFSGVRREDPTTGFVTLYKNGTQTATIGNHTSGLVNGAYRVGSRLGGTPEYFDGSMSEVIVFSTNVNSAERTLVENYLNSRYDIAIAGDHYSGDTSGNGDYDYDVFGIGRVDSSNELANTGAAGLGIEALNGTLGDDEWVMAGHNAGANAVLQSSPQVIRWQRNWYIEETGSVDTRLTFDWSDAGLSSEFSPTLTTLLYSPTSSLAFTSIATGVLVGDQVQFVFAGGTLLPGYYTLGASVPEPSTLCLLALAALQLTVARRRRLGRKIRS